MLALHFEFLTVLSVLCCISVALQRAKWEKGGLKRGSPEPEAVSHHVLQPCGS